MGFDTKMIKLQPTHNEVARWLLAMTTHALHIEYYLQELQIGSEDPQRPHDVVGVGNKFEWDVIKGFALQYREPKVDFERYIRPSLERHRCQYHHQIWNKPLDGAPYDAMKLGAVDAICSLLEPDREYQGGVHTFDQIERIAEGNCAHKAPWMKMLVGEFREVRAPDLSLITGFDSIGNIGVGSEMYDTILERLFETTSQLRERGYDFNF